MIYLFLWLMCKPPLPPLKKVQQEKGKPCEAYRDDMCKRLSRMFSFSAQVTESVWLKMRDSRTLIRFSSRCWKVWAFHYSSVHDYQSIYWRWRRALHMTDWGRYDKYRLSYNSWDSSLFFISSLVYTVCREVDPFHSEGKWTFDGMWPGEWYKAWALLNRILVEISFSCFPDLMVVPARLVCLVLSSQHHAIKDARASVRTYAIHLAFSISRTVTYV